ncbi:KGK domain-containing protein [Nostoc sp.]|uniref:KGK domain-containing protein n=1 Tax=Nostoc sp. TaxID=1180 RepID=UPI002FFCCCAB
MSDEIYLGDNDVVSVSDVKHSPVSMLTTTVGEMKRSLLKTWFMSFLSSWITCGMGCRVLLAQGGGWQAGKIRFRLEFIPNNPKLPEQSFSKAISETALPLADLQSQVDIQQSQMCCRLIE